MQRGSQISLCAKWQPPRPLPSLCPPPAWAKMGVLTLCPWQHLYPTLGPITPRLTASSPLSAWEAMSTNSVCPQTTGPFIPHPHTVLPNPSSNPSTPPAAPPWNWCTLSRPPFPTCVLQVARAVRGWAHTGLSPTSATYDPWPRARHSICLCSDFSICKIWPQRDLVLRINISNIQNIMDMSLAHSKGFVRLGFFLPSLLLPVSPASPPDPAFLNTLARGSSSPALVVLTDWRLNGGASCSSLALPSHHLSCLATTLSNSEAPTPNHTAITRHQTTSLLLLWGPRLPHRCYPHPFVTICFSDFKVFGDYPFSFLDF